VFTFEQLDKVFLDNRCFLLNTAILIGDLAGEELVPLFVGKGIVVQHFQLLPEIADEILMAVYFEKCISLILQQLNKGFFQFGFRLIRFMPRIFGLVLRNDSTFGIVRYRVVFNHRCLESVMNEIFWSSFHIARTSRSSKKRMET